MKLTPLPMPPVARLDRDVHVLPAGRMWTVQVEGQHVRLATTRTQIEAIAFGMELARTGAAMLVVHGRDGRFRAVYDYGSLAPDQARVAPDLIHQRG